MLGDKFCFPLPPNDLLRITLITYGFLFSLFCFCPHLFHSYPIFLCFLYLQGAPVFSWNSFNFLQFILTMQPLKHEIRQILNNIRVCSTRVKIGLTIAINKTKSNTNFREASNLIPFEHTKSKRLTPLNRMDNPDYQRRYKH